jgi:hypothetical protein
MTPKEKAQELVDKMAFEVCKTDAKQCALIAVDEMITNLKHLDEKWHDVEDCILTSIFLYEIEYLQEVKQEIKNYDR